MNNFFNEIMMSRIEINESQLPLVNVNLIFYFKSCINKFIDFFLLYIAELDKSIPILLISGSKPEPGIFLTNKHFTIIKIAYEMIEIFLSLLGFENRTNQLYKVI